MHEEIANEDNELFDFIIRGEGELTFNELIKNLDNVKSYNKIGGLSYKIAGRFIHNKPYMIIDLKDIKLPKRDLRLVNDFYILGSLGKVDVAETSRGCTLGCKFCSIRKMYGSSFRVYPIERVIEDLKNIRKNCTNSVFFTDDNITLNVKRFEELCDAIYKNG